MKKAIIIGLFLVLGFVAGVLAAVQKYESGRRIAESVVGYGSDGTTIYRLKLTTDGKLMLN